MFNKPTFGFFGWEHLELTKLSRTYPCGNLRHCLAAKMPGIVATDCRLAPISLSQAR